MIECLGHVAFTGPVTGQRGKDIAAIDKVFWLHIIRYRVDQEMVVRDMGQNNLDLERLPLSQDPKGDGVVFLLSSNEDLGADKMLLLKRKYWDIENGAHQRLDGSRLQEDKSRVRNRNSATNLGLFRRAALSLGRKWIDLQKNQRKATLNGFLGAMYRHNSELAFRVALSKNPSWLP